MAYGDNFGNGGSNDNINVTFDSLTAVEGNLMSVRQTDGPFGQSIMVSLNDVTLIDGVLMEQVGKDNAYKLFGWDEFGDEPSEMTAEDAPEEYEFSHPQGSNNYVLTAARHMESETGEMYEMGDVVTFESGSTKPSAFSRMLVHTVVENPDDAILSKENLYNWLAPDAAIRPDLAGRRVVYIKTEKPVDGKPGLFFHTPRIVDVETGQEIIKVTRFDDSETAAPVAPVPETSPSDSASTGAIDEFVAGMIDLEVDDADQILAQLRSLVTADGHDLSDEEISAYGGEDAVVAAIVG